MKPLQLAILVGAAALGGGVVMRLAQTTPAPASEAASVQAQVPPPPPVEERPSPLAPLREPPKPRHVQARSDPAKQPPASSVPAESAAPPVTPEPAASASVPPSVPPAPPEPEHVTPPPPPAPPEPHRVTLNAGTLLPVRLVDGLSSERNMPGDPFIATLDKELVVDGFVIAERGARVEGRVVASDKGGRVKGVSSLAVEMKRLRLSDGQTVALETESFERRAEQERGEDVAKVGAGAAIGAVIGAIAGGGKGAAIGAGVGGGAGAGTVLATRGKPVTLASETRLSFRLKTPVTITEKR